MFIGGGLTYGILLLALGVGYVVCYLAEREEKALRSLGLVIGSTIIVISALMLLNNLIFSAQICGARRGDKMGMMSRHKIAQPEKMPAPKVSPKK